MSNYSRRKEVDPLATRRTEPSWREFERVVAMIEESAAPRGAIVTSPDRIRDLTTGEMREVDASLRFRLGTIDILITIECQRRSRKANDMWIEQLATKRQKLGAAKTIAVSPKGFTRAALLTAKHYGIELRTLSEIKPEEIEEWFLPQGVVHLIPLAKNICCSVRVEGCVDYIDLSDSFEPRFFHDHVVSPFPGANFWVFHEIAHPSWFSELPRDGSVTLVEFDIDATGSDLIPIPDGVTRDTRSRLLIEMDGSRKVVTNVRIAADVSIYINSFDSADGVHHVYEATDGRIAQHARFKGEALGLPVTFDLAARGGRVSGVAEFPSSARIELGWTESILPPDLRRETCGFCDCPAEMKPQSVLPDFLLPPSLTAKEMFLCASCAQRFEKWDAYAGEVWRYLPEDLTGALHGAFTLRPIDGSIVRLWLLSLVWRMGASQALSAIDLGDHATVVRALLNDENPRQPSQYPVACIALSCEGRRVEFCFPPQWGFAGGQRVLSVVLQGVLFNFLIGTDTTNGAQLVSDDTWILPILDWREVGFLVDAALKARAAAAKARS